MQFYRVYHIDAHGEIAGLTNFNAANDVTACEQAVSVMAQHKLPGAELWEQDRRVHCVGIARPESVPLLPPSLCGFPARVA